MGDNIKSCHQEWHLRALIHEYQALLFLGLPSVLGKVLPLNLLFIRKTTFNTEKV